MLKDQPWIKLAPDMMAEYEQCVMEGLDVEAYKSACQLCVSTKNEALAKDLYEAMNSAPTIEGYAFYEPSEYDEIVECSPNRFDTFQLPDKDTLFKKIKGAWLGRMAGCLLGKPTEGFLREDVYPMLKATDNYPLKRYITKSAMTGIYAESVNTPGQLYYGRCYADLTGGISPSDDDTNYTVLDLKLVREYGKNFTPSDVLEAWLNWVPYLNVCTAERVAYKNAAMGLLPPKTATTYNPFREWIGAQIRGDFFGYVNVGNPHKAAEMAYRDASISHVKNGIYGEMFIAAAIAAAAGCDDINEIIDAGLDVIPQKCRLRRDIELVRQWYNEGVTFSQFVDRLNDYYPPCAAAGWVYTNPNTMIVVAALIYGEKKFGKSLCLAVEACYDTDCNGATVGSVIGMLLGESGIEPEWLEPFHGRLHTSIAGYELVDADSMAQITMELIEKE